MTIDRMRGRATNQNTPVERMWDRIILECRHLQITLYHLETPRNRREVYEMWKTRAPARPEMCSQECHKIGHFYKVCQSKKRGRRAHLAQIATLQTEQDTHIDENGVRQPNPPMANMLKIVNHIGTTKGSQEKHLKFQIM